MAQVTVIAVFLLGCDEHWGQTRLCSQKQLHWLNWPFSLCWVLSLVIMNGHWPVNL